MIVDGAALSTAMVSIATAAGGYFGGRMTGRSSASQIASDTVDMLQAQIEVLKEDKERKDLEVLDLVGRVQVLEGLVTQRADVEELSIRVSLVKETVDKIAVRVGA